MAANPDERCQKSSHAFVAGGGRRACGCTVGERTKHDALEAAELELLQGGREVEACDALQLLAAAHEGLHNRVNYIEDLVEDLVKNGTKMVESDDEGGGAD